METGIDIENHILSLDNSSYDLRTISDKISKGELNEEWKNIVKHLRKANEMINESSHLTRILYRELGALNKLNNLPENYSAHELLKEVKLLRNKVKLNDYLDDTT